MMTLCHRRGELKAQARIATLLHRQSERLCVSAVVPSFPGGTAALNVVSQGFRLLFQVANVKVPL